MFGIVDWILIKLGLKLSDEDEDYLNDFHTNREIERYAAFLDDGSDK